MGKSDLDEAVAQRAAEMCEHIITEMGAELHDDLVQRLSILRLYLDRLERSSGIKSEVDAVAIKMRAEFDQLIQTIRSISRRLMPVSMEGEMLDQTLRMLCQNMEHPGSCHIHFENIGTPLSLGQQKERYIFRIVQELIHNALKHSSAWHIWVRAQWNRGTLLITVEDDGTAFAKIPEFIQNLKKKNNTLRMRSEIIGARLRYLQGEKGLLAMVEVRTPTNKISRS